MVCFPDCHGGEGREEGKESEFREGLEEDMSVGGSTKYTLQVDTELFEYHVLLIHVHVYVVQQRG